MKKVLLFKIISLKHRIVSIVYPLIKHFKGVKSDKIKQDAISGYAKRFNCTILVETGTYLGDMVLAQKSNFDLIFSIEVDKDLYENAVHKFSKNGHINILFGDSGIVLKDLVPKLEARSIFWLDGHYSGGISSKGQSDCPIVKELDAIFKNNEYDHVILIDDARLFIGEGDYPTLEFIKTKFLDYCSDYKMEVKDDIARFYK